jgi:Na+/H+ antiporter NhaA
VIGLFYSSSLNLPALLAMFVLGGGLAVLLSRFGVWRAAPYALVGIGLWLAALQQARTRPSPGCWGAS